MVSDRFLTAVSGIAIVAAGGAAAAPIAAGTSTAFLGSVVTSALLALAFAGYNAYSVVTHAQPRFAAGFVAAVFGLWLVAAPLTYGVAPVLTGATQLAGTLLAATAGYAALDAIERAIRDVPVPDDSAVAGKFGSPTAGDD